MQAKEKYKVIIIGSGPAGSTAALTLAEAGVSVLILEKEKLPRYKTCGGGIIGLAADNLPIEINGLAMRQIFKANVNEILSEKEFTPERRKPIIRMVMRDEFDNALVNRAVEVGAEFKDECEVTDIKKEKTGIQVITNNGKFRAEFLICADGATGISSRLYNKKIKRIPAVELEAEVDSKTFSRFQESARFDFGIPQKGYAWVFPKDRHLSIGVLAYEHESENLNKILQSYLDYLGIGKINSSKKHGYFIPQLKRKEMYFDDRIYLIGDAAGLTDPITAEGISYAVRSGLASANALLDSSFESIYSLTLFKRYIKQLLIEIRSAKLVSIFVYKYPKMRKLLFKLYGSKLCNLMIDISQAERNYTRLISNPMSYVKLIKYVFVKK
jgi:geranylgeranyl reductase family protein